MVAVLAPQTVAESVEESEKVLCYYLNNSSELEVVRISNITGWYFERVAFPGQRLMFEAPVQGCLEIYTGSGATVMLEDHVACKDLQVEV
jgi:hypothetical protein